MLIPKKKWLGGMVLTGVLLTTSLTGVTPSEADVLDSQWVPQAQTMLQAQTTKTQAMKAYPQTVREAFLWKPAPKVKPEVKTTEANPPTASTVSKTIVAAKTSSTETKSPQVAQSSKKVS